MSSCCLNTAFYSWHITFLSLSVRKHLPHRRDISLVHKVGTAQMTLTLCRFFGQYMAQMGAASLEAALRRALETLCCTTIGFQFWHYLYSSLQPNNSRSRLILFVHFLLFGSCPALLAFPFGIEHHYHLPPFHFRMLLNHGVFFQIFLNPL